MKPLARFVIAALFGCSIAFAATPVAFADTPAPAATEKKPKNWTPPAQKIYAQTLSEQIMVAHPELLSVTFHGIPPGLKDTYTMFAGSYLDRIGNPDDPDDIDVMKLGITIVDPRWHRTKDTVKKFVMMIPLRDAGAENVGLLVLAYKLEPAKTEKDYFLSAVALRDGLEKQIPSYNGLFDPAK
jgi:hypothetical protein